MDIVNREAAAQEYIAEHRIDQLMKQLCELLIYNQVNNTANTQTILIVTFSQSTHEPL